MIFLLHFGLISSFLTYFMFQLKYIAHRPSQSSRSVPNFLWIGPLRISCIGSEYHPCPISLSTLHFIWLSSACLWRFWSWSITSHGMRFLTSLICVKSPPVDNLYMLRFLSYPEHHTPELHWLVCILIYFENGPYILDLDIPGTLHSVSHMVGTWEILSNEWMPDQTMLFLENCLKKKNFSKLFILERWYVEIWL